MTVTTVRLENGTVGQMMNTYADGSVNIWLNDENGNRIEKDGVIAEVIEEREV